MRYAVRGHSAVWPRTAHRTPRTGWPVQKKRKDSWELSFLH